MNKKELAKRVTTLLRDNHIKKPVMSQKHVFRISDDEGNTRNFVIKKNDRSVIYTIDDVNAIIDATILAIKESIKEGEPVTLRGFGTFGLKYRKQRKTKKPGTNEWIEIAARYSPKFSFGDDLRRCAKIYEMSLEERLSNSPLPDFDDEELDIEEGV